MQLHGNIIQKASEAFNVKVPTLKASDLVIQQHLPQEQTVPH